MLDGHRRPRFARRQGCRTPSAARVSLTVAVAGPYVYPQARHCRERSGEDYGGEFSGARNGAMSTDSWGTRLR